MINLKICTRPALLSAFSLLSRIPLPKFDYTANNVWAYPLVGVVLGICYALVFSLFTSIGGSPSIAIVFTLMAMAVLTGALHLDGLADTVDAIGGGQDTEHRHRIMHDSHLGTYGTSALILAFFVYFTTLNTLANGGDMLYPLIAISILSRMGMGVVQLTTDYAKNTGTLASTSTLDKWQKQDNLYTLLAIGTGTSMLFIGIFDTVYLILCGAIIVHILRKVFIPKINGITGDTLGATQVILDISLLTVYSIFL